MEIPLLDLTRIYGPIIEEFEEVLRGIARHQRWILGPELDSFEKNVAKFLGIKNAIGVSSGTDALVLALRSLVIRSGEEFFSQDDLIITTPFTFVATGEAIVRAGAKILFVDIDRDSFNISPEAVERALNEFDNVRGMVVVHLYGQSADMDRLKAIADKYGLFIVEDCAQSFGAKFRDKCIGGWGDVGCFSFFPTKNLGGLGDGGLVATDDYQLSEIIRMLRNHGGRDKYNIEHIGYNARLDTFQAGILSVLLKYIENFIEKRRKIASWYIDNLAENKLICLPKEEPNCYHTYNQFTIKVKGDCSLRDNLLSYLHRQGVGATVYYPVLLSDMKAFDDRFIYASGGTPNAADLCSRVVSLPIYPNLKEEEVFYVCRCINEFFRK